MMKDKTNTPDELLDLVDKDNRIIGETTKGEANKNPSLVHREIAIFIIDKNKRLLFHQRSRKKTVSPLTWICSVAGHISKGMNSKEAAHKELIEELGFDTELTFIEKRLHTYPYETHFCYWYIGKYKGEKINPYKAEIEQIAFLTSKELEQIQAKGAVFNSYCLMMANEIWRKR